MVPVQKKYIAAGHPNRPGLKLDRLGGIIVHYTGNDSPGATDTMNADYFGRPWHTGKDGKPAEWEWRRRYNDDGTPMMTPAGTPILTRVEVPFSFGSAQVICDEDSCTEVMPLDEVAWGCGDRRLPWTELNKGQQPAARIWFGNRQNYLTLNVEICNNGDWEKAEANAKDWIVNQLLVQGKQINVSCSLNLQVMGVLFPGEIVIGRHWDITGKMCPLPLVQNPGLWDAMVREIDARTRV